MRKPIKSLGLGVMLAAGVAMADATPSPQGRTQNDTIAVDATALPTSGQGNIQDQRADVSQGATLTDNQLTAAQTGSNVLSSSAFSGSRGINHVIQNTGNNVIIQDSTTFNVQFVPNAL